MRIDDKVNIGYDKKVEQGNKRNVSDSKSKPANVIPKNDQVNLSDMAKDLASLTNAVKNSADVRTDKIDKIKNEIEAGTYDVTGKQVAEKIVETAVDDLF
jgi:negative regulator of flagellin synthesis FlgM